MDAAGWAAVFAGFSAIIAVFAAAASWRQARRAEEQVETATRQAEAAEEQTRIAREALRDTREAREAAQEQALTARDSATSATMSADAALNQAATAREQLAVMRAQVAVERVERAREVHNLLRDVVDEAAHTLNPNPAASVGRVPDASAGSRAEPLVLRIRQLIDRLDDIGANDVARAYEYVHRYAQATTGLLVEKDKSGSIPDDEVSGYIEQFDAYMLTLRSNDHNARLAWARWRDENRAAANPIESAATATELGAEAVVEPTTA